MDNYTMLLRACRVLRPNVEFYKIMAQVHGYLLALDLQAHNLDLIKELGTVDALVLKLTTI